MTRCNRANRRRLNQGTGHVSRMLAVTSAAEQLESRKLLSADIDVIRTAMRTDAELAAELLATEAEADSTTQQQTMLTHAQDSTQPELLTPRGAIQDQSPRFEWSAVQGAARYELWVTRLDTNERVLHSDRIAGNSATINGELQHGNYRWWVRAFDAAGRSGSWSLGVDFAISSQQQATVPQPQSPSGQTTSARPEFHWSTLNGAVRYELWVSSLDSGERVLHGDQITGNSATSNIDLSAGNYRWWVRGFDAAGRSSQWSSPLDFQIAQQQSTAPQPQSPSGQIDSARPTFTWSALQGAVRYELWVSSLDSSERVLHGTQITETSARGNVDLPAGNYRWWVRGFDANGNDSQWSSPLDFQLSSQRSAVPTPQSPVGEISDAAPRFEWTSVAGAVRYELWVTHNESRQRVLHSTSITTNSSQMNGQLQPGGYTWWVRAFDGSGASTQWSAPAEFQLQQSAVDRPQPTGPLGMITTATPTFEWTAVNGAVRYELWVSNRDTNTRVLHSDQLTGTTATISNGQLSEGRYRWWVRAFNAEGGSTQWSAPADFELRSGDDQYEDNDAIGQSADLGNLTTTTRLTGLSLADGQDWFTFTTSSTGTADNYVGLAFDHARGDIDLRLYDANGNLVRASDSATNQETVRLDGLAAGRYFVQVYGYDGATNPSYEMEISPAASGGQTSDAYHTLYVNFDGVQLSYQDLLRYSQGRWDSSIVVQGGIDPERDGVRVQAFLPGGNHREQIIRDVMSLVQEDLNAYGIHVQRITGGAVEGYGASTIFVGRTDIAVMQGIAGLASEIDRGNDNPTDIAFVNGSNFSNYTDFVRDTADTLLHEAGHTWGMFHVNTSAGGTIYAETMGYVYTTGALGVRTTQFPDTAFLNATFHEFVDARGEHGLIRGVAETQNSHQIMSAAFGSTAGQNRSAQLALVDTTMLGVFQISGSGEADDVSVTTTGNGGLLVRINGESHILSGNLPEIRIYTNGDSRDEIAIDEVLRDRVTVIDDAHAIALVSKIDHYFAEMWNGTHLRGHHGEHDHGEHDHGEHDHGEHDHGEHDHGEHEHGEHEHGDSTSTQFVRRGVSQHRDASDLFQESQFTEDLSQLIASGHSHSVNAVMMSATSSDDLSALDGRQDSLIDLFEHIAADGLPEGNATLEGLEDSLPDRLDHLA